MLCIWLRSFLRCKSQPNVPSFSTVNPFAMTGGRLNPETDKLLFVNTPKLRRSTLTALISFLYLSTSWPNFVSGPGTRQAPEKHITIRRGNHCYVKLFEYLVFMRFCRLVFFRNYVVINVKSCYLHLTQDG